MPTPESEREAEQVAQHRRGRAPHGVADELEEEDRPARPAPSGDHGVGRHPRRRRLEDPVLLAVHVVEQQLAHGHVQHGVDLVRVRVQLRDVRRAARRAGR